mmetsp:Transcript_53913/g.143513  ORF Transcript_53913/g.143513 Transcript_53913/m.143513 type:complete len:84 (-) Transcript_53913:3-254(-)
MFGAIQGHLVQFVKGAGEAAPPHVLPVDFDQKGLDGFWQHVLPQVALFVDTVYRFRADDGLRYRFLVSSPEEQLKLLEDCGVA